jgi:hypothetical protein
MRKICCLKAPAGKLDRPILARKLFFMKITLLALALLATSALFWYCRPTKYTTQNMPLRQLRFGNGGGYVGKEKTFTLLENGQLFKMEGVGADTAALKGAKRKIAASLFKTVTDMGLERMAFQHPGNTYQFIEVSDSTGKATRIAWGDNAHPVDEKVKTLYSQLTALVKGL